jgi:hypothetical protein
VEAGKRQAGLIVEVATGLSVEVAGVGRDPGSVTERRAERATEAIGRVAKRQVGSVDPGMGSEKSGTVAGERKAVASDRLRSEERLRRAWKR